MLQDEEAIPSFENGGRNPSGVKWRILRHEAPPPESRGFGTEPPEAEDLFLYDSLRCLHFCTFLQRAAMLALQA